MAIALGPAARGHLLPWRWYEQGVDCGEIEVRFTPDGPDQTTVAMEHRRLERLGCE